MKHSSKLCSGGFLPKPLLSNFEEFIEDHILGGGGPLPGPQGVSRDMYREEAIRVGDHFQVLKVSEGTILSRCELEYGVHSFCFLEMCYNTTCNKQDYVLYVAY